jgi:hypothetical protein
MSPEERAKEQDLELAERPRQRFGGGMGGGRQRGGGAGRQDQLIDV